MKILAVLATYVPNGQKEFCPARSSRNPDHYEWYMENKFETIKFVLACHEHYKAGLDYDMIVVDSSSPDSEWLDYAEKKLKYPFYQRENVGFSFGSHKWAWEKFGTEYDYYLFMEQDCAPTKDDWLKDVVDLFESEEGIGAVGNFIEQHRVGSSEHMIGMEKYFPEIKTKEMVVSLDGFYSFTSSKVLSKTGLHVEPVTPYNDIDDTWNELGFQQTILDGGYRLKAFFGTHKVYHGVSVLDSVETDLPLAPLVLAHTRLFEEKPHFAWYESC